MNGTIIVGRSVLETITVALYENPIILFREYVQNSLDARNRAINDGKAQIKDLHVTLDVDKQARRIVIKDNGYGIDSYKAFENRMLSIGSSHKESDRTKYIGFRGIGRISGLPFCDKLIFRNKQANSNTIHECIWDGDKYRKELSDPTTDGDLETIITHIVTVSEKAADDRDKGKQYFEVILENYTDDIKDMLADDNFKVKLTRMLPLEYSKKFSRARDIEKQYKTFMGEGEDLRTFMIPVKYQGENLVKGYDDSFILESDIVFWEVRGKKKKDGALGDKMGLLWFTFESHLTSSIKNEYYGILTRSKNVLMRGDDTFAQVADENQVYVTTFREMAQMLRGVYGELLINAQHLSDNSRRDWFLPDEHSRALNYVITDYMRRLHQYRYCASRYFRKNATKTKEELKHALDELVDLKAHNIDFSKFAWKEETTEKKEPSAKSFSEQDIPHQSLGMKKSYDLLMMVIETYFKSIKKSDEFLRLRAYIANYFKSK